MWFRLILILAPVALIAALVSMTLLIGWPASRADQWLAITALATSVVAVATTVALLGVVFLAIEGRRTWQRMRAEVNPYLRVDLAMDGPFGTFRPPDDPEIASFDYADFNPTEPKPGSVLDAWEGDTAVALWVRNQLDRSGGVARNVRITVEIDIFATRDSDELVTYFEEVQLHYLEPGRAVKYTVATLSDHIPFIRGRVRGVVYHDMHGNRLHVAHGSSKFEWDGHQMVNERQLFVGEEFRQ